MRPFNLSLIETKERRKLSGRQRFIYSQEIMCIFEDFPCRCPAHTIELACRITASNCMKCQKRLPLLLGERDSVNGYVTPLSSCTRKHPYLLTKVLSVCQKEDKNVRITTQNVDLLVPSCCCVSGMQYYSSICLLMI